jgi:hypothetical protein
MYLEKLNPYFQQGADPFEISQQLGMQGLQDGMQARQKVARRNAEAQQIGQQMAQQMEKEQQEGLGSLLNIGAAFATGGTSAGLGALASEAIGGPVGDLVGAAVGGNLAKGAGDAAASTAGNALTEGIDDSVLGNLMNQQFGDSVPFWDRFRLY